MFGRKKKKKQTPLFGGNIEPNCAYCAHSATVEGGTKCQLNQIPENASCKRYTYDPLRRAPKGEPALGNFTAEDFKL